MKHWGYGFVIILIILFMTTLFTIQPINVKADSPKTITVPDEYSTVQEAVENANDGDTIYLKEGVYEGPINQTLLINKTLSIIGADSKNTIINLHPLYYEKPYFTVSIWVYDSALQVETNNFKISGITLKPNGGDIIISGNSSQISNSIFESNQGSLIVNGNESKIANNTLTLPQITIHGTKIVMFDNKINLSSGPPAFSCKSSSNILVNNTFSGAFSIYVEGQSNLICNNTITNNDGLDIDGAENVIAGNNVNTFILLGKANVVYLNSITKAMTILCLNSVFYANNITLSYKIVNNTVLSYKILWRPQAGNTLYENNFSGDIGLNIWNGQENRTEYWDNGTVGNYWSSYKGTDANNDGIGDTPFLIDGYNVDRYPLVSPFNTSTLSFKTPDWAIEQLASAFTPTPTQQPTPSPSVPEFSWLTILPILLTIPIALAIVKTRMKENKTRSGNLVTSVPVMEQNCSFIRTKY